MARILYVEDNGITRLAYSTAFRLAGHEVTACENYYAAKRVLDRDTTFDLVITDGRYDNDQRFPGQGRDGCLSLLADIKAMHATMPVAILSMEPADFQPEKLPEACLRPIALYSKTKIDYYAMAEEIPKLLKLGCI